MSMKFDEAIDTLHGLFPDWDRHTLSELLQQNQLHMERTVECILGMDGPPTTTTTTTTRNTTTSSQQVQSNRNSADYSDTDLPSRSQEEADLALAKQLSKELNEQERNNNNNNSNNNNNNNDSLLLNNTRGGNNNGYPPRHHTQQSSSPQRRSNNNNNNNNNNSKKRGRGAVITLPDDFLRIPGWTGNGGYDNQQLLEDEQLASMLQNELFLQQLQSHPEFAGMARNNNRRSDRAQRANDLDNYLMGGSGSGYNNNNNMGMGSPSRNRNESGDSSLDDSFKQLRKNVESLGTSARLRFNALAVQFRSTMNQGGIVRDGTTQGLLNEDEDDEEEEVIFNQDTNADLSRRHHSHQHQQSSSIRKNTYDDDEEDGGGLFDTRSKKDK